MSAKKKRAKPAKPPKKAKTAKKATPRPPVDLRDRELELHREELAAQNEEMREANAELVAVRERYALLYDVAPVGYFTLDHVGRIIEANLMAADLLGVPRRSLFERNFDELVVAGARDAFRHFRRRAVAGDAVLSHDTVLDAKAGNVPVHVELAILTSAGSGPRTQILLCVSDERARRRGEDERRRLEAETAEDDRLKSLGVLAGGIAHEFNNALAVVLACADLAIRDLEAASPARSALIEVRSAAERAAELSRQMQAYTGRAQIERADVDVSEVVQSVESILRAGVGHDVRLVLDLARDLPRVRGDAVKLRQIVVNLVVNASEALAGAAGTVTVRTSATERDADEVMITVVDDGPGIDADVLRHVFDPFFSTKLDGRGLGLAVAFGHARAHGGTITVESSVGSGTTFRVVLPAHAAAVGAATPGAEPALVLVVDDDRGVRRALGRCLEHLGYACVFAEDGRLGVEEIERRGGDFALVLLDIMMPVLDGRGALAEMLELRPDLRIVMMSGHAGSISAMALPRASGFLAKPFDLKSLERVVTEALSVSAAR